jgi:long-chain acyl-CoA synthetase
MSTKMIRQFVIEDVIKTRGGEVHPNEVEAVLYSLPGIKEAAVVGVPDEALGHRIKAIVVIEEGVDLSEQDVLRHCARHLEEFKVPQSVEFRERLPQPTNGKITKPQRLQAAKAA